MADCKWPGGCKLGTGGKALPAVAKSTFCDKHRLKAQADEKLKKEKEKAAKELADRQDEMLEMAEKAKKTQAAAEEKKKKIQQIKATWNQQVQGVVQQVKQLRAKHPDVDGINAGSNDGVGDTAGGSKNPLELKLPSDAKGIAKGEIFPLMAGFDGSDSAGTKIRINDSKGNILIHVK